MSKLLLICVLSLLLSGCSAEPSAPPTTALPEPVISEATPTPSEPLWTEEEVNALAQMVWGEARGVPSDTEKAACVWCVLNRVDYGYGNIITVVTAPYQFVGYDEDNPIDPELKALCEDVLTRWYAEKDGKVDVGRVLPADYMWFTGDGERNYFRNVYQEGQIWDWSLPTPYES